MKDLREGVKLKKVQERQYNPLPIEYQLTPYEMLMDDIRAKRYKLRKVMVSVRFGSRLETDATCQARCLLLLYCTIVPIPWEIAWKSLQHCCAVTIVWVYALLSVVLDFHSIGDMRDVQAFILTLLRLKYFTSSCWTSHHSENVFISTHS